MTSAQNVFSEKGYDAAGTREIAAGAEVNIALIARYFGSKRSLFERAVLSGFSLGDIDEEPIEKILSDLANQYAEKSVHEEYDPMLALIRSAASEEVGDMVRETIELAVIRPLAEKLGGKQGTLKAALIVSQLAGFDLMRRIVGIAPFSQTEPQPLVAERLRRILLHEAS